MFNLLKKWGEVEIPLTAVVIIVAITVMAVYQPQKEVYYIPIDPNSQKLHGV